MMESTPWLTVLAIATFFLANALYFRSAFLLASTNNIRIDLFSSSKGREYTGNRRTHVAIGGVYLVVLIVYIFSKYVIYGFFSLGFVDFLGRLGMYLLSNSRELGILLMIASIPPAVVGMFNFVFAAALLSQFGRASLNTPSPIIGFFGAFLALLSFLGSLASIWAVVR